MQQGWAAIDALFVRYRTVACPGPAGTTAPTAGRAAAVSPQCGRFDVEIPHPVLLHQVRLQGHLTWALIVGLRDGKPVAGQEAADGALTVVFESAVVDALVIYTQSGGPAAFLLPGSQGGHQG